MTFVTIIVHYNNPEECCRFVSDFLERVENHPVILVDNNSTQSNLYKLKTKINLERVLLIESIINDGFGAGVNIGVKAAQKFNPEYLHVVNTDVILLNPYYITELISVLKKNTDISLAGPLVYKNRNNETQNTILPFPSLVNSLMFRFRAVKSYESNSINVSIVSAINGVCFVVINKHFNKVGGFTESYFMYGEEQDLAYKLLQKGYKSAFVSTSSIIHLGANIKPERIIDWKFYAVRANQIRFISMYRTKFEALLLGFVFLVSITVKIIYGYKFVGVKNQTKPTS
jgi:GT2 family glycosyltransferase